MNKSQILDFIAFYKMSQLLELGLYYISEFHWNSLNFIDHVWSKLLL